MPLMKGDNIGSKNTYAPKGFLMYAIVNIIYYSFVIYTPTILKFIKKKNFILLKSCFETNVPFFELINLYPS